MTFLLNFLFKEIIVGLGNSLHQETVRDPQDSAAVVPEFEKYRSKAEADIARLREETNGLKEKVEMLEGQLSKGKATNRKVDEATPGGSEFQRPYDGSSGNQIDWLGPSQANGNVSSQLPLYIWFYL